MKNSENRMAPVDDLDAHPSIAASNFDGLQSQCQKLPLRELAPRSYDSLERAEADVLQIQFYRRSDEAAVVKLVLRQDMRLGISGVLYNGALLLASHLVERPELLHAGLVVELGCGTACAGLVAAALGADVVCTDRSEASLRIAESSAVGNGLPSLRCSRWEWREVMPEACVGARTVLAADLMYTEETSKALLGALDKVAGVDCVVLVAFKIRDANGSKAVRFFLNEARKHFQECVPLALSPGNKITVETPDGVVVTPSVDSSVGMYLYKLVR